MLVCVLRACVCVHLPYATTNPGSHPPPPPLYHQDVHTRFRTEAHADVVARFNERFILSLASCEACLVLDDELNVLPISRHAKKIVPVVVADETAGDTVADVALTKEQVELAALKESIAKTPLVRACAPQPRARVVLGQPWAVGCLPLVTGCWPTPVCQAPPPVSPCLPL